MVNKSCSASELKAEPLNSSQTYTKQRMNQLGENPLALAYLAQHGIDIETIKCFKLGLSTNYKTKNGILTGQALLAPVIDATRTFTKKNVYLNLPGITLGAPLRTRWMKGDCQTHYADGYNNQKSVIVCDSLLDLWLIWQQLQNNVTDKDFFLICSTHPDVIPKDWHSPNFWKNFSKIYFVHDTDTLPKNHFSQHLVCLSNQTHKRVVVPSGFASWADYFASGMDARDFQSLLASLPISVEYRGVVADNAELLANRQIYEPVDVVHSFHNNHLYYPVCMTVKVSEQTKNVEGKISFRDAYKTELVLIKSDRSIQHIFTEPAPRGTPPDRRLQRLTDGTIIGHEPPVPANPTWRQNSIWAYLEGRADIRSLADIMRQMMIVLKNHIWLPNEHDYSLLACLIPVTYCHYVFDAVPLVLVNGPPATGKSRLGQIMAALCANSQIIGQGTFASITRQIDQSNGLFVLDDLESLGTSKRNNRNFDDTAQFIKISYKQDTASRLLVDNLKSGRQRKLNLFGVKIINLTQSVDDVVATRMINIKMKSLPPETKNKFQNQIFDSSISDDLRNDLHVWIHEHASLIAKTYRFLFPGFADRETEITAPLKVFAKLSGDESLANELEAALEIRRKAVPQLFSSHEALIFAAKSMINEGQLYYSATSIQQKIEAFIVDGICSIVPEDNTWKSSVLVGRFMKEHCANPSTGEKRQLLGSLMVRSKKFSDEFIRKVLDKA